MLGVTISVAPGMCDWQVEVTSLNTASGKGSTCEATATVTIPVSPHIVANVDKLAHVRLEFVTHDDVLHAEQTHETPEVREDGGEASVEEEVSGDSEEEAEGVVGDSSARTG